MNIAIMYLDGKDICKEKNEIINYYDSKQLITERKKNKIVINNEVNIYWIDLTNRNLKRFITEHKLDKIEVVPYGGCEFVKNTIKVINSKINKVKVYIIRRQYKDLTKPYCIEERIFNEKEAKLKLSYDKMYTKKTKEEAIKEIENLLKKDLIKLESNISMYKRLIEEREERIKICNSNLEKINNNEEDFFICEK